MQTIKVERRWWAGRGATRVLGRLSCVSCTVYSVCVSPMTGEAGRGEGH